MKYRSVLLIPAIVLLAAITAFAVFQLNGKSSRNGQPEGTADTGIIEQSVGGDAHAPNDVDAAASSLNGSTDSTSSVAALTDADESSIGEVSGADNAAASGRSADESADTQIAESPTGETAAAAEVSPASPGETASAESVSEPNVSVVLPGNNVMPAAGAEVAHRAEIDSGRAGATGDDLATQAREILAKHCYRCHGQNGANEGGFNFVLQPRLLSEGETYLKGGAADESYLIQRIVDGSMPPDGEEPRMSADDLTVLKSWVNAGAVDFGSEDAVNQRIADAEWLKQIAADLEGVPERSRRFIRYFNSVPLANAGATNDQLVTWSRGLSKLLNSLSWNAKIVPPLAVNASRTILRIDLRDYQWSPETWDLLLKHYEYGVEHVLPEAAYCMEQTDCRMPWIRTDWFIARAAVPPLYHDVLRLPATTEELEAQLRVPVAQNIRQEQVIRSGFNESGISQQNRVIERHVTSFGAYWKSYDFRRSDGTGSVFENPLGPGTGRHSFVPDGNEVIFNLPNGLHAFLISDAQGRRIDKAPSEIVTDPGQPDRAVVNGLSCMSCHLRGIIPKADQVRDFLERNPSAFDSESAATIRSIYVSTDEFLQQQAADTERYQSAVRATGNTISRTESLTSLANRFDSPLSAAQVAAEVGIEPAELERALAEDAGLARVLGPLLSPGGVVHRASFTSAFPELLRKTTRLNSLPPTVIAGGDPARPDNGSLLSNRSGSVPLPTGFPDVPPPEDPGQQWEPAKVIPLASTIPDMMFSPDGEWLYLLNASSTCVQRLNMRTLELDPQAIPVNDGAEKMRMHPSGKLLYVAAAPNGHDHSDMRDGVVQFLSTQEWKVDRTRTLPFDPWDFAVSEDGILLFTIGGGQSTFMPVVDSSGRMINRWMENLWHRTVIRMLPNGKRFYLSVTDLSPPTIQGHAMPKDAKGPGPPSSSMLWEAGGRFMIAADGKSALTTSGQLLRLSGSAAADLQRIGTVRPVYAAVNNTRTDEWIAVDRDANLIIFDIQAAIQTEQRLKAKVYRMAFQTSTGLLICAAANGDITDPFDLGVGDLHIYRLPENWKQD